jgi:hypothetical protein
MATVSNEKNVAHVHVTAIGKLNTATKNYEMTTDLPAENMGEAVCDMLQLLWKWGEDPAKCTLVITFE